MHTSVNYSLTIFLVLLLGLVEVFSASYDPVPFYQRSKDGANRYGYSSVAGFSARQSATSANEGIGQYDHLQPDGKIANGHYRAGLGGFRPQYGTASGAYGGAAIGVYGTLGGLRGGQNSAGALGSGSLNSRYPVGGATYGPRMFNALQSPIESSLNGGGSGLQSQSDRLYGDGVGTGSIRDRFYGGNSLGPGSSFNRSPIGGSLGHARNSEILPGRGQTLAGGDGSFGTPYISNGLTGTHNGVFPHSGPQYPLTSVYNGGSNIWRLPIIPNTSIRPPAFTNTTPLPISNIAYDPYGFANTENNPPRRGSGTVTAETSNQNNRDPPYATDLTGVNSTANSNSANQLGSTEGIAHNNRNPGRDSIKHELADQQGNAQGSYSTRNEYDNHDHSFVPGSGTRGTLDVPNGINQRAPFLASSISKPVSTTLPTTALQTSNRSDQGYQNELGSARNSFENGGSNRSPPTSETTENHNVGTNSGERLGGYQNFHQNGGNIRQKTSATYGNDRTYFNDVNDGFRSVGGILANTNGPSGVRSTSQTGNVGSHHAVPNDQQNIQGASSSSFDRGNRFRNGASFVNSDSFSNSNRAYGGESQESNNFSYDTGRQAHQDNSDGRSEINGRISYLGDGGRRSSSYRKGPETGFKVTDGNLATKIPK